MTVMYGINNCDTVRKAKKWLTANQIEFEFHDFKKQGVDETWLKEAIKALSWEVLLNKRGTTFRQLDDKKKADLSETKAHALMLENPSMIKRPVLSHEGKFYCGFSEDKYADIFSQ
jgi:Spx/MgsR family transcriptional regulator